MKERDEIFGYVQQTIAMKNEFIQEHANKEKDEYLVEKEIKGNEIDFEKMTVDDIEDASFTYRTLIQERDRLFRKFHEKCVELRKLKESSTAAVATSSNTTSEPDSETKSTDVEKQQMLQERQDALVKRVDLMKASDVPAAAGTH